VKLIGWNNATFIFTFTSQDPHCSHPNPIESAYIPLVLFDQKNNNPKIADINKIVPTVKLVLTFKMLIQIKIMENKNNKNFGHGVVFSVKTACQLLKR